MHIGQERIDLTRDAPFEGTCGDDPDDRDADQERDCNSQHPQHD
jgi:hypothetical protein